MSNQNKYEVLKAISYKNDRIERGSILSMTDEEAKNIGEEYLKPVDSQGAEVTPEVTEETPTEETPVVATEEKTEVTGDAPVETNPETTEETPVETKEDETPKEEETPTEEKTADAPTTDEPVA